MKVLSIRFYLHASTYSKKSKDYRLYFRVTYDGHIWATKTSYRLKEKQWNDGDQFCLVSDEVNEEIASIRNRIYRIKQQLRDEGKPLTILGIKEAFLGGEKRQPLTTYMYKVLKDVKESPNHTEATYINWKVRVNRIAQFLEEKGLKSIIIQEIDIKFIQNLDNWLSSQISEQYNRPFQRSYINQFHKKLKAIFNRAIQDGLLDRNPYIHWKIPKIDRASKIKYLTGDELEKIYNSELGGNEPLQRVRDMFVFAAMTGLRFSDATSLKVSEIQFDKSSNLYFIQKVQQKTKAQVMIPLLKWAEKIYHKYKDSDSAEITGRLLPIYSNVKVNAYLKEIASLSNVDKELTYHMARHTCATMMVSNNVPLEQVAEIMGHQDLETTKIYAKITKNSLAKTAAKMNDWLKGMGE